MTFGSPPQLTAKAGRPDVARAGVQILRQLHSGAIRWAWRPSDGITDDIVDGLFLGGEIDEHEEEQAQSDIDDAETTSQEGSNEDESEEASEDEAPVARTTFAQLEVEEEESD